MKYICTDNINIKDKMKTFYANAFLSLRKVNEKILFGNRQK